jgi:hypothetical protein
MTSTSELRANDRRNWKAEIWNYDHYIPDDSVSCLYCLTEKQAELLRGVIQQTAWKTRWFSQVDTPIDQDQIEQFRDDLTRRLMMPCGCDEAGTLHRYTSDGHYQSSSDGGATWADDTPADPRTPAVQYPPFLPPDTVDGKCTYADSIVTLLKTGFVDTLADGSSYSTIVTAFTAVIATIFAGLSETVIGALIIAVAGAVIILIVTIGVVAFQAAMTSDVWNRFRCNLYCHMNDDGTFTEAQTDAIWTQVAVDESGLAAIFLQAFVATARAIGLTNAARSGNGHADADCSACCPTCGDTWDIFGDDPTHFHGTILSRGDGFMDVSVSSGGYLLISTGSADDCCIISSATALTGTMPSTVSWTDCGVAPVVGAPQHAFGIYGFASCINYFQFQVTPGDTLTVHITFAPC